MQHASTRCASCGWHRRIQHGAPVDPGLVADALSKATLDFSASGLPTFMHYVTSLLTDLDGQPTMWIFLEN